VIAGHGEIVVDGKEEKDGENVVPCEDNEE
jgi:hypothetical protein